MTSTEGDARVRLGRVTLFIGHLTMERLLGLPGGLRITGMSYDFPRLGILLGLESDSLPALDEGTVPLDLGRLTVESMTDESGATWHRVLLNPT